MIIEVFSQEPMVVKGGRNEQPRSRSQLEEHSYSIHDFDVDMRVLAAQERARNELYWGSRYSDWEDAKLDLVESAFWASSGYEC